MINALIWSIIAHFGFGSWAFAVCTDRWSVESFVRHRGKNVHVAQRRPCVVCVQRLGKMHLREEEAPTSQQTGDVIRALLWISAKCVRLPRQARVRLPAAAECDSDTVKQTFQARSVFYTRMCRRSVQHAGYLRSQYGRNNALPCKHWGTCRTGSACSPVFFVGFFSVFLLLSR